MNVKRGETLREEEEEKKVEKRGIEERWKKESS